jgi:3-hydroxybutyryl-CoA dehydrogenase
MKIQTIGVVGAGAMGRGIAQIAATSGCDVLLYDLSEENLMDARDYVRLSLDKLSAKGKISPEEAKAIFGRLYFTDSLSAFEACDLVIEAVVERLEVKQHLFEQLESIVSSSAILATNTSSLSVSAIASSIKHPERVIGLHFFNPAVLMPLVEIIPAIQTHISLIKPVIDLMRKWGKDPVEAKDTPGFIVNRIARPYYSESIRILEEGIADTISIDDAMTRIGGFRMGPFTLMDFIGHDVNFTVTKTMYDSFYQEARYKPSFTQQRLVEAGYLGKKSGRGFYRYDNTEQPVPTGEELISQAVFERVLTMLLNEAADALHWGIANAEDIDTAMIKGVNYPKGLLHWGDELGWKWVESRMDQLFDYYRDPRYRTSPMVRQLAGAGKTCF